MTKSNPVGGLLDLIERKRNGRNNPEMARDSGGLINKDTFANAKAKGVRRLPDPDTIRGYAKALGVTVTDVVLAVAVSVGLEPEELGAGDSDALIIDGAGRLPDESRRLLRDMAGMMLAWQERAEAAHEDAPPAGPLRFPRAADDPGEPTASDVVEQQQEPDNEVPHDDDWEPR